VSSLPPYENIFGGSSPGFTAGAGPAFPASGRSCPTPRTPVPLLAKKVLGATWRYISPAAPSTVVLPPPLGPTSAVTGKSNVTSRSVKPRIRLRTKTSYVFPVTSLGDLFLKSNDLAVTNFTLELAHFSQRSLARNEIGRGQHYWGPLRRATTIQPRGTVPRWPTVERPERIGGTAAQR